MLKFSLEDWDRIQRDNKAWWAGKLPRPLVYLAMPDPRAPRPLSYMSNYPLEMPAEQVVEQYAAYLETVRFFGDAFPWLWVNFGPGIAAGFLGANVNSVTEPSETVWFTPREPVEIGDLRLAYDPENVYWKRVKELTTCLVGRFGDMLAVSHTDLGGNLDILASLRDTHGLLLDVLDYPEDVERLVGEVTRLWIRYYDELDAIIRPATRGTSSWAPIWSPGKTYMLQCDFSYMISPAMFERFVMPDLAACCDFLDHAFYHLDGKGEIPHLDMLLGLQRLRGIRGMGSLLPITGCRCWRASARAVSYARCLSPPKALGVSCANWAGRASCLWWMPGRNSMIILSRPPLFCKPWLKRIFPSNRAITSIKRVRLVGAPATLIILTWRKHVFWRRILSRTLAGGTLGAGRRDDARRRVEWCAHG